MSVRSQELIETETDAVSMHEEQKLAGRPRSNSRTAVSSGAPACSRCTSSSHITTSGAYTRLWWRTPACRYACSTKLAGRSC